MSLQFLELFEKLLIIFCYSLEEFLDQRNEIMLFGLWNEWFF